MHILNIYRYAVCSAAFLAILGGCATMPNKSARSLDLNDPVIYAQMKLIACLDASATAYVAYTAKDVDAALRYAFDDACDGEFDRYIDVVLEYVGRKNSVTEFDPIVRPTVENDARTAFSKSLRPPLEAFARGEFELAPLPE